MAPFWRRDEVGHADGTLLEIRLPAGTPYYEKRAPVCSRPDLVFCQIIVHVKLTNVRVLRDVADEPLCLSAEARW